MSKRIIVMPAYMAEHTLEQTYKSLPQVYDEIILCDDGSTDATKMISKNLGLTTVVHTKNRGYGANQKTLYHESFKRVPDVVVMVHPDNQYDTANLGEMISLVRNGTYAMVIGSRMNNACKNGMPWWKFIGNRFLTCIQNGVFGTHLSEFHSGLRAYNAEILKRTPFDGFSDSFGFDSEMIAWFRAHNFAIGEIPVDSFYSDRSSSVNFFGSVRYGFFTLGTLVRYITGAYSR